MIAQEWLDFVDKGLVKWLSISALLPHKKSNRLYVCMAGSSVNRLPDKILEDIKKHDSIGVNGWVNHAIVPTFQLFEVMGDQSYYLNTIIQRSADYSNTPKILKCVYRSDGKMLEPNTLPDDFLRSCFITNHAGVSGHDREAICRWLVGNHDRFLQYLDSGVVLNRRGSGVCAMLLGHLLGYTDIILVGMDITDGRHFYLKNEPEAPHPGENPTTDIPVSQIVLGIHDALEHFGKTLRAVFPSPAFNGGIKSFTVEDI